MASRWSRTATLYPWLKSPSVLSKFSPQPSPATSHVEIYKNLKKLTLKLAEKKKENLDTQGDDAQDTSLTSQVRKRRRSKLVMEEMDSPGVVRKLAVVVNNDVSEPTCAPPVDTANSNEIRHTAGDGPESSEGSGPSHRIGLSGANKRMLHLLKKAKVQLIKIDQQKQFKLSQEQPLGGPRIKHVCRAAAVALGQPRALVPDDIPRLSALPLHEREGITFSPTVEAHTRRLPAAVSRSDVNWDVRQSREASSSLPVIVRKKSLRNITPRSYSSLLKSESEEESEQENEATFKSDSASADSQECVYALLEMFPLKMEDHSLVILPQRPLSNGVLFPEDLGIDLELTRQSPPPQEHESTEEPEPRDTLPDTSPPRIPLAKLQQQLQIHLYRLPDFILRSALPVQLPQCLDRYIAKSHPKLSQPAAHIPVSPSPRTVTLARPRSSQSVTRLPRSPPPHTTPPFQASQQAMTDAHYPRKSLLLRLHRLPQSLVQSALKLHECMSPSSSPSQQHPQSPLHPSATEVMAKLCFQERSVSEVQPLDVLPERGRSDKDKSVFRQPLKPHAKFQETAQEKQAAAQRDQPEKEGTLQNSPATDPHYVLHSQNPAECTSVNTLTGLTNGFPQKGLLQNKHKIRVDFKEDCAVKNVWAMGGLSVLTSVPTTPQPVCLLCASKGRHEMIYCQICCEPFHTFCLLPGERPERENKENWCCRRCKFCHVCGRRSKHTKPVLQCRRCQTSYHPSCLGPTYPKPINCSLPWVCMTCIRCKSCGVTPGKSWDMAWNHEQDLCPDCTSHYKKGHFCTVCHKCYEDSTQHTQMIQCSKCSHWLHYKCEGLSDELFVLLSSQREEVTFTCSPCGTNQPEHVSLREKLQDRIFVGLQEVLTNLLSSDITQHLFICKRCQESDKMECVMEQQPVCDLQAMDKKFKGGSYTSVKAFHADVVSVMRKWLKEEEFLPEDQRLTSQARDYYVKLMQQVFSCLPGHHLEKWNSFSEDFPSGMLPEAVLPPSKEHSYAQWLKRTYQLNEPRGPQGGETASLDMETRDLRQCALCQQYGDSAPSDSGRLLYLGQNEWAHINCCLWSAEVYEENSALLQVHSAVSRGRHLRCDRCGQSGATVGCCLSTCQSNFHFMCARAQLCVFQQDRKVYCYKHRELVGAKVSGEEFQVSRRVYVDFEGITLRRKFLTGLEPESIHMTIGSLQIQKLGVLSELSSNGKMLYPVGYQCSRLYWSTVDPRRRCKYICKVTEVSTPLPGEEQDPRWDQGQNHTIVHSPNLLRETEDAAVATTNGISLAPDNLEEEVAHLMSQELPYTVFDTDTEVAVASVLNAKLEFDETLLTENVVLNCGAQGERGEVEGVVQDVEMQEKDSEGEEDSSHYFKHKRTVVCEAASSTEVSGLSSTQSISQLDGADGGSESDESDAGDSKDHYPEGVESEAHTNHSTPTKQLTVALKRLESIYTVSTEQQVPRPVTSPIIINGLKALPINTGATRVKPIAIRLAGSQSQLLIQVPVSAPTVAVSSFSNLDKSVSQSIIDTAMASHHNTTKTKPIILNYPRGLKARQQRPSLVRNVECPDSSEVADSECPRAAVHVADDNLPPNPAAASGPQVCIKRRSSASHRPSRKRSKMDFLRDVPYEPDEEKDFSAPVREGMTHMWVSARHGDLTEWGPYSGFSSEDDAAAPKHKKRTYMNQPHLRFEITSEDGFSVKANSIEVAWRAVIDSVLEARAGFHLKQLPLGLVSGPRVFGVVHDAVIFLLEQLQGVEHCKNHRFRFHHCSDIEEELPLNPSGCAR
ncbi:histone-lysine N-methyltransferase 2B-like, partial [Lampetra planeri]